MKWNLITLTTIVLVSANLVSADMFKDVDITLSAMYKNLYVSPGGSECSNGKAVFQPAVDLSFPSGLFAGVWHNGSLDGEYFDNENKAGSEIDATLGYATNFNDATIVVGASYWGCGNVSDLGEGDILFTWAEINRTYKISNEHSLTPFTKVAGYFCTDGFNGDGFDISVGLRHGWKITHFLSANSEIRIIYDNGIFCGDDGFVLAMGTTLSWPITEKLTLQAPYLEFFTPVTVHDARESVVVCGLGLSYKVK